MTELLALDDDPIDGLISEEERSELNFNLSRLSRIHREILICYYLREMAVNEIADLLEIPVGTVKRRLYDAKNQLSEQLTASIETAKPKLQRAEKSERKLYTMETTGRSAFAPADVMLSGGYSAPNYWDQISDLMTKQIFAICASKAHTVREIADEIGVAPVYFEEKLKYLLDNKFIKEASKGKYLTDFVVLPRQKNIDINHELSNVYADIAPEIRDIIVGAEDKLRGFDYYGNDFPLGKLMWLFYVSACSVLADTMTKLFRDSKPDAADNNGKSYRITAYVTLPGEKLEYKKINAISWSNIHHHFRTSEYNKITYANLYDCEPFSYSREKALNEQNIALIMRLMKSPDSPLTSVEEIMAAELIVQGFLEKRDGGLYPTLPIMPYQVKNDIDELLRRETSKLAFKYVQRIGELGDNLLLPSIHKDLYEEYVNWTMRLAFDPLCYVMWQAINAPEKYMLEIPADYKASSACTALYYR